MQEIDSGRSLARAAVRWTLATLVLTAAHHVYGGLRYGTPWRLHGAAVALLLAAVLLAVQAAYRRDPDGRGGRAAGWTLLGLATLVVLGVGAFEGGYNHLVKDALFLAGAPRGLLVRMFPPPAYELPNDAVFEVSGVAQVIPGAIAAVASVRFLDALLARRHGVRPAGLAGQR